MNKTQLIKSLKLDQWFAEQMQKTGSLPEEYYWNFLLNFVLKNLSQGKKAIFIGLLEKADSEAIAKFILENIENFEAKFSQAFGEKIKQLKTKALNETE